jgi:hypothetical protein
MYVIEISIDKYVSKLNWYIFFIIINKIKINSCDSLFLTKYRPTKANQTNVDDWYRIKIVVRIN